MDISTFDSIESLEHAVVQWHYDRNLINGSSDTLQVQKLDEEFNELIESVESGTDITDDIGDMLVVMINLCERNGINLFYCLHHAYNEIKDRKGRMVNGLFVKEN